MGKVLRCLGILTTVYSFFCGDMCVVSASVCPMCSCEFRVVLPVICWFCACGGVRVVVCVFPVCGVSSVL